MRMWLAGSAKTAAFGPSGAISLIAHAVLIGGAVYGTGRASRALEVAVTERVHFLPPPDRSPSDRPQEHHVRYVPVGRGVPFAVTGDSGTSLAGKGGDGQHPGSTPRGADDADRDAHSLVRSTDDSVYSVLEVDEAAARVEGSDAPVYPPALIERFIEGTVRARYVVDTTGRADPESIEILSATHPEFAQSVRDAIPRMRFTAGLVRGQPVRQLVEQSFGFRIAPPVPAAAEHTRAVPAP